MNLNKRRIDFQSFWKLKIAQKQFCQNIVILVEINIILQSLDILNENLLKSSNL